MNARVYFIGDTHFGHQKVATSRGYASIADHDADLVARWNAVVRQKDSVWHLGDVLFGRHSFAVLGALNGYKRLVMGNHDMYDAAAYLAHFKRLCGAAQYQQAVLSHIPVSPCQFSRWERNIHGHTHSRRLDDVRYVPASAEQTDLRPMTYDELMGRSSATYPT